MKILVAGGAGFIGTNFIRYPLSARTDFEVLNFDKLACAGNLAGLHDLSNNSRCTFEQGDICDPIEVTKALAGCDSVVHFAAESHVDRCICEPSAAIETNLKGVHNLFVKWKRIQEDRDGTSRRMRDSAHSFARRTRLLP